METQNDKDLAGQDVATLCPEDVSGTDTHSLSTYRRQENDGTGTGTDVSRMPARGSGCDRDAEEYNMCHPRRGVALIFNHEKFDHMTFRSGSSRDCANLSVQLQSLGFDIQVHTDLSYNEMLDVLMATAAMDHGSADCLLVAVMTHGETGLLHSRDTVYKTQELWLHFTGDKCHSLIGKPKLFFIQLQACRGTMVDSGVSVDDTDGYTMSYVIPTYADFLIVHSTVEGYYSWRNPSQGSWFIQSLCEELHLHGRTRDLMTLLTFVCRRVAINYHSNVPCDETMDLKKQIPSITSMLTRLVYFRQSE